MHTMGKPLGSYVSFRPISQTSCISKLFENIIPSRLLIFLELHFILFSRRVDFSPGRSTLNQILYRFQSLSNEFNKRKPGIRAITATIDFFKAILLYLNPASFHKQIPTCFSLYTIRSSSSSSSFG